MSNIKDIVINMIIMKWDKNIKKDFIFIFYKHFIINNNL